MLALRTRKSTSVHAAAMAVKQLTKQSLRDALFVSQKGPAALRVLFCKRKMQANKGIAHAR
jgi:hypothetical protein